MPEYSANTHGEHVYVFFQCRHLLDVPVGDPDHYFGLANINSFIEVLSLF